MLIQRATTRAHVGHGDGGGGGGGDVATFGRRYTGQRLFTMAMVDSVHLKNYLAYNIVM